MNLEESIKKYLEGYFEILKEYKYQRLNKNYQNIRKKIINYLINENDLDNLKLFTILILYYGSKLSSDEIIELKKENIIFSKNKRLKVKLDNLSLLLDEECSEVLSEYLKLSENNNLFINFTINDIYKIIQKYPNDEIIKELSHCFTIYKETDYEVIPTPLRMNVDLRYTGKGVTIAFIDSGFYPHPDITKPVNRVLKYVNIAEPDKDDFSIVQNSSWHGMQTSLSACGNGYLSGGLYRGIASDSNLVLLKVTGPNGIETTSIIKAVEWVIKHKEEYNIKILNISLGGDRASSYIENALDQAVEGAVQSGITVVVAVGNDGEGRNVIGPPASAPSVITVGGLDDKNTLDVNSYSMYRSSYGFTLDGLLKPEVIAPGIWIAAPILPETEIYKESILLNELLKEDDINLKEKLKENLSFLKMNDDILNLDSNKIRDILKNRIKEKKIIGTYYQHVDGTSFSSPIVASVIAQMLEANPNLNPRRIKQILTKTTDKLFNVPIEKQGYGLIHARKAVKEAINDLYRIGTNRPMSPFVQNKKVTFYHIDSEAHSVSLVGDFNGWNPYNDFFIKEGINLWKIEKEFQSAGSYRYKFVVDGKKWVVDKENENREPDGFGGFNNRLNIFV
jgi:serine protease AprX